MARRSGAGVHNPASTTAATNGSRTVVHAGPEKDVVVATAEGPTIGDGDRRRQTADCAATVVARPVMPQGSQVRPSRRARPRSRTCWRPTTRGKRDGHEGRAKRPSRTRWRPAGPDFLWDSGAHAGIPCDSLDRRWLTVLLTKAILNRQAARVPLQLARAAVVTAPGGIGGSASKTCRSGPPRRRVVVLLSAHEGSGTTLGADPLDRTCRSRAR